jgi:hypothetical protein
MKNIFSDEYSARKTLREIKILRKLSQVPNNLFTTKLLELILPENLKGKKDSLLPSIIEEEKVPFDDGGKSSFELSNKKTHYDYNPL